MAKETGIEWTDATFNPWVGCTKVSPGCDHCYAEARMDTRLHIVNWGPGAERKRTSAKNWKGPREWNDEADHFEALYGRRRRVFCASLADVYDNEVDPQWRADLFELIQETPRLDWLLLTKRIGNVPKLTPFFLPHNVWLGASIVNQEEANRDVAKLLDVKANNPGIKVFLSMEPLLSKVSLQFITWHVTGDPWDDNRWHLNMDALEGFKATSQQSGVTIPRLDWVIVGGESGPGARPMDPRWVRMLRAECEKAGTPFLFKQWGEWVTADQSPVDLDFLRGKDGSKIIARDGEIYYRVGKHRAGRTLDGQLHDGYPKAVPAAA